MANKIYLNGIFANKKTSTYGEFWNLWIPNVDEFIQKLRELPQNQQGGINFTLSEQKADPTKGSITLYQPEQKNGSAPARKPAPVPADDSDDLPF